ncbi:uncharacterized protein LTHEOB_11381 [Lasiodiplodia theobromae]|uniref:uncharacterized protein n=1 Tax=Lasiodiplodia theobromae TaxID=45133 RepID=UPI0015C3435B|nr:uncharacterized protein LTHEOB_11381 [Lasiodiplodia theobromae]KAF4537757.1 hypothetical protein LTHEOB_11381 [Lasiodiplodia theobromae]
MRFFSKLVTSLPLIAGICCTTSAAAIRRAVDSEGLAWSILDLADMSHNVTEILYHCEERDKNDPFWQDLVIEHLTDLTQNTKDLDIAMNGTQAFTDEAAQKEVCDSYDSLFTTQKETMDVFVEKGYFRITDAGVKIESLLEQLAGAEDTLGSKLINAVPFCADAATDDKKNLDTAVKKAICVFKFGKNC